MVLLLTKVIKGRKAPNMVFLPRTDIKKNKVNWIKRANSYIGKLQLSWDQIREMSRTEIKRKIRDWDTETWKN